MEQLYRSPSGDIWFLARAPMTGLGFVRHQANAMGFYQRWILPRLIDLAMGADRLDAYRRKTIGAASGPAAVIPLRRRIAAMTGA
jgi:hypothetical protein